MVLMMAMTPTTDATAFGGKMLGGHSCHGSSCHGAVVASSGCHGSSHSNSCHGGGHFLGLRGRGCHGSSCHGTVVAAAPAATVSAGCHGSSCHGTSCHGGGHFLGHRSNSCHGCHGGGLFSRLFSGHGNSCSGGGCTGAAPAAPACCNEIRPRSTQRGRLRTVAFFCFGSNRFDRVLVASTSPSARTFPWRLFANW
jgi:hypothetical protein